MMPGMLARVVGRIEGDPGREGVYRELERICPQARALYVTYRDPEENARVLAEARDEPEPVTEWHQDGWPGGWEAEALLLWSNREPTEVREHPTLGGRVLGPFRPGDVVLVMNRLCEHRVPPDPSPDRAFARVSGVDPRWFPQGAGGAA